MDDFEKELKTGFLDEVTQLLADTEQCFLALESSPNDVEILDKIFRLAHNLKGSAKAVGFDGLGEFTHQLESYLLKLKNGAISIHSGSVSLLLRCNDHITKIVRSLKENFDAKTDSSSLLEEIRNEMEAAPAEAPQEDEVEVVPDADAFSEDSEAKPQDEITAAGVSELLAAETAEKLRVYSEPVPPVAEVVPIQPAQAAAKAPAASAGGATDESIRVSLTRLENLMDFVGELVILQTVLREQVATGSPAVRKVVHQLGKVTKEVQDLSMSLRMVPVKQTFQKMQRIVRDISTSLGKTVHLELQGEDTELDKTVLEKIGDPLVHLVRNAVDHGIESAEERKKNGKSEAGTVRLNSYHQSGSLIIEVHDDGAGLSAEKLRNKAIEKGVLKPGAVISDRDAYQLIFSSGFSTKAEVTDISGRGVGMAVVKTNIEQLQGDIQIETQLGKGTCFRIRLPLTLAIIDGMVIRSDEERYVIPLSHVHESVQPTKADLHFVTGVGEIFALRGENLPLYRLSSLLGRKAKSAAAQDATNGIAIVVRTQEKPFSILVDDIIGQHQVVIKQLGGEHKALKGFSGSAILGDGRPALILELPELTSKQRSVSQRSIA